VTRRSCLAAIATSFPRHFRGASCARRRFITAGTIRDGPGVQVAISSTSRTSPSRGAGDSPTPRRRSRGGGCRSSALNVARRQFYRRQIESAAAAAAALACIGSRRRALVAPAEVPPGTVRACGGDSVDAPLWPRRDLPYARRRKNNAWRQRDVRSSFVVGYRHIRISITLAGQSVL